MPRYLISFDDGAMAHLTPDNLAGASVDSHRVVADARAAGVWVTGGGIPGAPASVVAPDGSVSTRPYPDPKAGVGGFSIVEVGSKDEALHWAARIAEACRCAQEVREIGDDPEA